MGKGDVECLKTSDGENILGCLRANAKENMLDTEKLLRVEKVVE
jgi:hypothetical protein